jgi:hypothetical protein
VGIVAGGRWEARVWVWGDEDGGWRIEDSAGLGGVCAFVCDRMTSEIGYFRVFWGVLEVVGKWRIAARVGWWNRGIFWIDGPIVCPVFSGLS